MSDEAVEDNNKAENVVEKLESPATIFVKEVESNLASSVLNKETLVANNSKRVLEELSKDMLRSTGDYIKDELEICISDYKTLEQMNKLVAEKYKNLTKHSSGISNEMTKLNDSYSTLLPLLSQIDDVEACVSELEQSALKLDAYSKKLEARFKQFTEKFLSK